MCLGFGIAAVQVSCIHCVMIDRPGTGEVCVVNCLTTELKFELPKLPVKVPKCPSLG